jgi:hypothetical protein
MPAVAAPTVEAGALVLKDPSSHGLVTIDTTTGAVSDSALVTYKRGGASKWSAGLNRGGLNTDAFDFYDEVNLATYLRITPGVGASVPNGTFVMGSNTVSGFASINGPAGVARYLTFATAGLSRWFLRADGVAEAGANAGSDFQLYACTDAGGIIDIPISIVRAAGGAVTMARPLTLASTLTVAGRAAFNYSSGVSGSVMYIDGSAGAGTKITLTYYSGVGDFTIQDHLGAPILTLVEATKAATFGGAVGIGVAPVYTLHVQAGAPNNFLAAFLNTHATGPNGLYIAYTAVSPNAASNYFIQCDDSTTFRFLLYSNGGIGNYSANNVNVSDERLKTMGATLDGDAWSEKFAALDVRQFKYLDQTHDDWNLGMSAQHLESIAPELVATDEVSGMKGIYTSDLYNAHIAVTQSLLRRIAALEAQVKS